MIDEKALNAQVAALSKYGEGVQQGVRLGGIEGWWKLSLELQERLAGQWPPAIGHVLHVRLRVKSKGDKPGWWQDILEVSKATGPAETWHLPLDAHQAAQAAPQSNGTGGGGYPDTRDQSISRAVVVKAEADVLANLLTKTEFSSESFPFQPLYKEWRDHCAQLWGDVPETAAELPTEDSEPVTIGIVPAGDEVPF